MKNFKEFNDYIDLLASEYKYSGHDDIIDYCHEAADSSEHVIYNGMAWDLVNMMRLADHAIFEDAELILENNTFDSLQSHITAMAYEIIYQQLNLALNEMAA
jgi:hypothetical protein